MTHRSVNSVSVVLVICAVILSGCAGNSKPSKFYLLRSLPESKDNMSPAVKNGNISVLIGPITLPAYLDRTQIVTIADSHELVMDEFARWAEPLQDNLYRVLVENLSLLLKTPQVYAYKSHGSRQTDFQVVIDVTRFDSVGSGDAVLTVFWSVVGKDDQSELLTKKSVFRAETPSKDFAGVIEAHNRTLTGFSREIAAAIQSLQP